MPVCFRHTLDVTSPYQLSEWARRLIAAAADPADERTETAWSHGRSGSTRFMRTPRTRRRLRLVVVDHDADVRLILTRFARADSRFEVVGQAEDRFRQPR